MEHAVVDGEFVTYSHIKTRKTFSIVIEFPEEQALHVLNTLGSPVGGNSKRVAVCLLNEQSANPVIRENGTTEGEKLRIRAVMLCKDSEFHDFVKSQTSLGSTTDPQGYNRHFICRYCQIKSRSELATNIEAQKKFKELDRKYKEWLNPIENQYADNLNRY